MTALVLAALLAAPAAGGEAAKPFKAPRAPDFSVATVLGAPVNKVAGLKDLAGKVVYLEFWATWCPPCVAGIPRTNRIIDKLAGEPVVFLFVTDEPATKIEPFLAKREVKAWVGLDVEKKTLGPYKVKARPRGYLIGKDGSLLASIAPESLKEEDVRAALAGTFKARPVDWGEARTGDIVEHPHGPAVPKPALTLTVSTAPVGSKHSESGGDAVMGVTGHSLGAAVAWAWGVSESVVRVSDEPAYSVDASLESARDFTVEHGRRLMQGALQAALGIKVVEETQDLDVFVLKASTAPGAPRPPLAEEDAYPGLMSWGNGRLSGNVRPAEAAQALDGELGRPVVDETGLTDRYSFDLEWKGGDEADRARVLADVGLRLVPARRPVRLYRVLR